MSGFVVLFLCVHRFLTQGVESTNLVQHQSNDNRLYVRKRGRKNACHSNKLKRKYKYLELAISTVKSACIVCFNLERNGSQNKHNVLIIS